MNNSNNHQHHLQQVHRQFITYGSTPVVPLSSQSHSGAPQQAMGIGVHTQAQQQNGNGSLAETMAPSMGFLGHPQTYMNFGVGATGAPLEGQLALVLIPPGLNPSAAVAASCQMLVLGCAPATHPAMSLPQFTNPSTSFLNMSFNTQQIHGSMNPAHSHLHQQHHVPTIVIPEGFQFINAPPSPQTTNPSTPGNLNPHAETFVPTNSSMRSFTTGSSRRERGGGDTHQQINSPGSGDNSAYNIRTWRNLSLKSSCISVDNCDEDDKLDNNENPENANVSAGSGEPDLSDLAEGRYEIDSASASGIGTGLTSLKLLDDNSWSEQMTYSERDRDGFTTNNLTSEEHERHSTRNSQNQDQGTPRHCRNTARHGRRGP